ncbi:MAG: prephenate dehydratase domain-containing protein [Vampirovibrionales bacterium]|nr:prephenate dehydratase domain-containing protein [Vampirovibrionales bacterium]
MAATIGYLGPEGSHSHEALLALLPKLGLSNAELVALPTLRRIGKALHESTVDAALMPVENALEGSIGETLETVFLGSGSRAGDTVLPVLTELAWPVAHALITKEATSTPISHVISHPQALAQCRETLIALYGDELIFHTAPSTAEAVSQLAHQPSTWAALGTQQAANNTGCLVLNPNVSDSPDNATRFWLIAAANKASLISQAELSQTNNKIAVGCSLCIGLVDRPGVLVDALLVLKAYGITMTRIESRPARSRLGEYLFFIDVACDLNAPEYERVRLFLQSDATLWRLSTAYPALTV